MSILAGKVTSVTGMVQAKNPITGEIRLLKEGDEVFLGDVILTSINGGITVSLENGDMLTLGRDTQMSMDEDVVGAPGMTDPVTEAAVDVEALQQAVLEGNFEGLEETAAGGDAGATGSANAGATNTVDRIGAEGQVTSGFDTSTSSASTSSQQEQGDNNPPEVFAEEAEVFEDSIITGQIEFIDENPETSTVEFAEGTDVPVGLTLNPDGSYIFDANSYDELSVGQTLEYVLPIVVTDGEGATTESTFTVRVIGINDNPELVADSSGAMSEDAATVLSESGALSYTDVDQLDTHTMSAEYNEDIVWSGGDLTPAQIDTLTAGFSVDLANWDYSVANSAIQFLAEGQTIVFSYDVTVDDQNGGTDTQPVTLTITGTNDTPVISGDSGTVKEAGNEDDGTVVPGIALVSGVVAASDADSGAVLTFSGNQDSPYGAFTIDENSGEWTYSLDNVAANTLAEGETQTETFVVTVTDDQGATSQENVVITIQGTNDSPIAEDAAFRTNTNQVEFSLADFTSDVEDDRDNSGESFETRVEITSLPQFGDLFVGTNKLAIGDMVDDPTTIRYEVDPDKVDVPAFDADSYLAEGYNNNNKTDSYTTDGFTISGGTFTGDKPDENSTLTAADLNYVSESSSSSSRRGLGVGRGSEIDVNRKEFISVEFPELTTQAVVTFASIGGHYQDSAFRPDAQLNVLAFKDGELVSEFVFNDTHNGSGLFNSPIFNAEGFDEIRVFTTADRNSNITLQAVEVTNTPVEDSFNYNAVDVNDAYEPGTVTINAMLDSQCDNKILADADRDVFEIIDVNAIGETTCIVNYDVADDVLDLSDLMDSGVTKNNLDQYLKLAYVDDDGDGTFDSTIMTIDSNGDQAGGDISHVYIQDAYESTWKILADDDAKGKFDLDD